MTFTELQLAPPILKAIAACGYTEPTPIQAEAIPKALSGVDLMATAKTGTGKTAAFVLPALQRLGSPSPKPGHGPRVLVLTPTRELATQVTDAVRTYGRFMRVRSGSILGGMPYRDQLRLLSGPVDLLVATPGRLVDLLERGKLDLSRLEILVLDEADRMLDMGFSEDVNRIAGATPAGRQTLLFTATLDKATVRLAEELLNAPERIEIVGPRTTHDHIEQRLHVADDLRHKNRLLHHLIADGELRRAIIFSATKRDAENLAVELKAQGHAAAALHGDMPQGARNRTITAMKQGRIRLLVATDVAARGLDVSGISHVINFDLPRFAEDYVHRIGRTGRAGASGIAISFASLNELSYLDRIERYIGQQLPEHAIPGLEPARPLVRLGKGRSGAPGQKRGGKGFPPRGPRRENAHATRGKSSSSSRAPWQGSKPAGSGAGKPPRKSQFDR
ncbi:DEAD/DEAH box helicase [Geobacter sp.]|uniref:DEAD/DEAH box helicase n=1 Tax=Geobacter sp. TaxID=46610 RepID=UPI002634AD86|nr:DEAD/DEAH box helicase [Geobacter sp.]